MCSHEVGLNVQNTKHHPKFNNEHNWEYLCIYIYIERDLISASSNCYMSTPNYETLNEYSHDS